MSTGITHDQKLLQGLLKHGRESEWIEFKKNNSNTQVIGETLAALSNSAFVHDETYGYLVFGVEDETLEVVGTTYNPFTDKVGAQELENWLATQLDPRIDFKIISLSYEEKSIFIFRIDATHTRPVSFKGIEFIRVGSCQRS